MTGDPFSKACAVCGCSRPAVSRGRCQVHAGQVDRARGLASDRQHKALYNSARWRRLRTWLLREQPVCRCAACVRLGRVRPASVVHHLRPHGGDERLFFDPRNLVALAKECHDAMTATGQAPRGEKIQTDAAGDRADVSRACVRDGAAGR